MKLPMFIDWRFLKNNIKNRNFDLSLLELDIFHYSSSSLELNVLRKFCIHQKAVSERTGEIIHVNARRFRHTRGTNLGSWCSDYSRTTRSLRYTKCESLY